jgi:hypothetical protein
MSTDDDLCDRIVRDAIAPGVRAAPFEMVADLWASSRKEESLSTKPHARRHHSLNDQ